jgi:SpoVK/Ycf46/Vps4 family AAA+-type ATPase
MMCSRKLGAFTLRLFDRNNSDSDLDELFDEALRERPAMILLEDLDRAFPRTGEAKSQISLQHLLNALDGVATGEGIVVVATANEPTALDPAILRRPGRFDRVVQFLNPNAALRAQYLQWMNPAFTRDDLQGPVAESDGFSFAQLRESFVLAAQLSPDIAVEITGEQLLGGIKTLRHTFLQGSKRTTCAGFAERAEPGLPVTAATSGDVEL